MIRRHLQDVLRRCAAEYPVVALTGPRQSGKTTLVRATFRRHEYASLEDPDQRRFALEDPRGFLGQFRRRVVLDEVQRAPELMSYIQTLVDERDVAGRFILTGSQNFLLMRDVSQSLAGRSAVLHLLPFSRSELLGRSSLSDRTLGRRLPPRNRDSDADPFEALLRGFYPRIHDKGLDPTRWYGNYYQTYVERDVRELLRVHDLELFHRFVRLCAGRNGQLLNLSSLASDCGVTHPTARGWISVLEASFLVKLLRPYHRNYSKRLVKSPKLYFLDTGLLSYLLGVRSADELRHHPLRGAVFESYVVAERMKASLHRGEEPRLSFWRDSAGHEVDLVVDLGSGPVAVEIKSGQTIADDFFRGLRFWRGLPGNEDSPAALVHGGERTFRREGVVCCSWSCL